MNREWRGNATGKVVHGKSAQFHPQPPFPSFPVLPSCEGKTTTFAQVADLRLDRGAAGTVTRRARRQWAIENETLSPALLGEIKFALVRDGP